MWSKHHPQSVVAATFQQLAVHFFGINFGDQHSDSRLALVVTIDCGSGQARAANLASASCRDIQHRHAASPHQCGCVCGRTWGRHGQHRLWPSDLQARQYAVGLWLVGTPRRESHSGQRRQSKSVALPLCPEVYARDCSWPRAAEGWRCHQMRRHLDQWSRTLAGANVAERHSSRDASRLQEH